MVKKYVKNPIQIEAIQWDGKNLKDVKGFISGTQIIITSKYAEMQWDRYEDIITQEGLFISTLEGNMRADIGDFIIKGIKGEFYPCKPDIFESTYTEVE